MFPSVFIKRKLYSPIRPLSCDDLWWSFSLFHFLFYPNSAASFNPCTCERHFSKCSWCIPLCSAKKSWKDVVPKPACRGHGDVTKAIYICNYCYSICVIRIDMSITLYMKDLYTYMNNMNTKPYSSHWLKDYLEICSRSVKHDKHLHTSHHNST